MYSASYYEIYNETLADLLNPSQQRHLNVRWHKDRGFYVENLFLVPCDSLADLMAIIEEGKVMSLLLSLLRQPVGLSQRRKWRY